MTEDHEYAVTQEHMLGFGAIIHWFARVEMSMQIVMVGITKAEMAHVMFMTQGLGYSGRRDALLSLLRLPHSLSDEHVEQLKTLLGQVHKWNPLRNDIAHNSWISSDRTNSIKPMRIVTRGGAGKLVGLDEKEQDYTPDELLEIADEIGYCYKQLVDLLDESGLSAAIERNIDLINSDTGPSPGQLSK